MVKTLLDIHSTLLRHQQTNPSEPSHQSKLSHKSVPSKDIDSARNHVDILPSHLKLKVLIVDDNLLNLRVMKQLLKKKLARFLHLDFLQTASSGLEALDLLSSQQFHLVFLDISMPGISGLEVCRRLRQSDSPYPQLHICAVTTDLAEWQIQHYRSFGMDGVIGKPLKDSDLQFALEACLEAPLVNHTFDDHMCCQSNPRFYYRRHGAHQPLPPSLSLQTDSANYLDQSDSWDSLSSVTSTAPPSCPICQAETGSIMVFPADYADRKFRQQSILSDTGIMPYEDSERPFQIARPCLEQLNLTSESLNRERSSSFESFDTSTPGSMTTCSSGPSSVPATDLLSPSYPPASIDMPQSASCPRIAAFPTAPLMTCARSLPRVHSQRRSDSFSCSFASNSRPSPSVKKETDVFADGFMAAMNIAQVSSASLVDTLGRSPRRRSHDAASSTCSNLEYPAYFSIDSSYSRSSPHELRNTPAVSSTSRPQSRDGKGKEEKWMEPMLQLPLSHSTAISKISAVTRQLITRRSHPVLKRNRTEEVNEKSQSLSQVVDHGLAPTMRKCLSASGLPTRPSWQLVQLSALNYQSVLTSGGLLDEVLIGIDLEDHQSQKN